jgi:hypothetical protein
MNKTIDIKWPYVPTHIKGIDHKLIEQIAENNNILNDLNNYIQTSLNLLKKYKIIELNNTTNTISTTTNTATTTTATTATTNTETSLLNNFNRLEPPFNIPCTYANEGCIKKAAFLNDKNNSYYCWFHVNCSK